jgi:hypothetical protein
VTARALENRVEEAAPVEVPERLVAEPTTGAARRDGAAPPLEKFSRRKSRSKHR